MRSAGLIRRSISRRKPRLRVRLISISLAFSIVRTDTGNGYAEGATVPLASMTAAVGLYQRLALPLPWHPTNERIPLIVYGAASAVGSYVIQLAKQSNIHPLICVAGRGIPHVESLIDKSKGDTIIDYRDGDDKVVEAFKSAAKDNGGKIEYAFDAVSEKNSYKNICKVLDSKSGAIALVLPGKEYSAIPPTIRKAQTAVGTVHKAMDTDPFQNRGGTEVGTPDFGFVMYRLIARGLNEGWFKGHPFEVVPGGLGGIEGALKNLKDGKASAVKYVFRIADTDGVGKS